MTVNYLKQSAEINQMAIISWVYWFSVSSCMCDPHMGNYYDCTPHTKIQTVFTWGFPGGSYGKESACNAGDLGLIPGSG